MKKGISPAIIVVLITVILIIASFFIIQMFSGGGAQACVLTLGGVTIKGYYVTNADGTKQCVPKACTTQDGKIGVITSDGTCIAPSESTTTTTPATTTTTPAGCGAVGDYCGFLGTACCQGLECPALNLWKCKQPEIQPTCGQENDYCGALGKTCCEGLTCDALSLWKCKPETPKLPIEGESCAWGKQCVSGLECKFDALKITEQFWICAKPEPTCSNSGESCHLKSCCSGFNCELELSLNIKTCKPPVAECAKSGESCLLKSCCSGFACFLDTNVLNGFKTCKSPTTTTTVPVACTQDAMRCPDGTYVGRVPPSCNFAPCPSATTTVPHTTTTPTTTPYTTTTIYQTTTTSPYCHTEQRCEGTQQCRDNYVQKCSQSCGNVCGQERVDCDATYPCNCAWYDVVCLATWNCVQNPLCKVGNWMRDVCNYVCNPICTTVNEPVCWIVQNCYDVMICA